MAGYVFGIEPVWLRRYDVTVRITRLPEAFHGYTIAQLSDLHLGSGVPESLILDAVGIANAARPDLAVITGDIVHRGTRPRFAEEAGRLLAGLRAPDGRLAVLGNHDSQVYRRTLSADRASVRRVAGALADAKIQTLQNEVATIERDRHQLRVVGLGDLWSGLMRTDRLNLKDAIVLEHNPDAAPQLAKKQPALVLCGHTHGGQVSLPFLGPPILPIDHTRYAAGLFTLGGTRLYVNRGVGWLRRVRMFVRPEVTILTLKSGA